MAMTSTEILQALARKAITAEQAFRLIKEAECGGSATTTAQPVPRPQAESPRSVTVRDWVYATCAQTFRMEPEEIPGTASFIDLGANSLLLQELIRKVEARFGLRITAAQFMTALSTVDGFVRFIETRQQPEGSVAPPTPVRPRHEAAPTSAPQKRRTSPGTAPYTRTQQQFLDSLIAEFVASTQSSKALAEQSHQCFADQRSGWFFSQELKEIHYPIVFDKAHGASLTDVDGNEYLDLSGDFGVNLFGHADPAIQEALTAQIGKGLSLSTSSPLLAETAALFCEMTGTDRVVFTQSGTEAVMSALRLARAATGRSRIVKFNGAFHGHFDGILVSESSMPHPDLDGVAAARPHFPGTPQAFAEDVVMLDYDTNETLATIDRLGDTLAAVLVEPIQSRNPDLQPREFLLQLRDITRKHGIVLIFDEMITGFRVHPRGVAGYFGIDCDLATYGKVVTGGLSGGCVAGKADLMEWVNGGNWRFGDDSRPSLKTTFIAGTHTQNPAVIAGMHSVLTRLKDLGPEFQEMLNQRTRFLAETLNAYFAAHSLPLEIVFFGSLFRFRFLGDSSGANAHSYSREMAIFSKLLQHHRLLYNQQGNCFLTAAHGEGEISRAIEGITTVAETMLEHGFFKPHTHGANTTGVERCSAFPSLDAAVPQEEGQTLPLSMGQQGLYFEYQLQQSQRELNIPLCLRIRSRLDLQRLRESFARVVERHPALRTGFHLEGNVPVQRIHPFRAPTIVQESLENCSEAAIHEQLQAAQAQPFDLEEDPLFRVHLFTLSATDHYLLLVVPHILADGFSVQRLFQDFLHFYAQGGPLPEPVAFATYIEEEAQWLQSDQRLPCLEHWKTALSAPLEPLLLPTDFIRSKAFAADHLHFEIDAATTQALRDCARNNQCTLFALMVTAYAIILHNHSGQSEILLDYAGVPMDRATRFGQTVGYFINKLGLKVAVDRRMRVADALQTTGRQILANTFARDYPFPALARELHLSGQTESLFRAMINMDFPFDVEVLSEIEKNCFQTLAIEPVDGIEQIWPRDVFLNISENGPTLRCLWGFNACLFTRETMERMARQFVAVLQEICTSANRPIAELRLESDSEFFAQLQQWNATAVAYPNDSGVAARFEHQVQATPGAVAVTAALATEDEPWTLSYRELNQQANQLAHYLSGQGVSQGAIVAVCMERTPELVVVLLAILKTGGAYLPIDPDYPQQRQAYMLQDAGCRHLLTLSMFAEHQPKDLQVHCLDALRQELGACPQTDPEIAPGGEALAYVIYTSGSTGEPKGVMIPHRAINRLVCNSDYVQIHPGDKVALLANPVFDASTFEIWAPLLNGGTIVMFDKNLALSPEGLQEQLRTQGIRTLFLTTALLNQLTRACPALFAGLRDVLFGGELVDPQQIRTILEHGAPERLLHVYGPTESTTFAAWYPIREIAPKAQTIPIGKPLANTTLYVLDEHLQPCPPNITGELYIGGDGLALGYLNRPELTETLFLPNPFADGTDARMYKTGDRARLRPDAEHGFVVEFLGRIDQQVKLRGFRIETGEIEASLCEHPGIRESVVALYGNDSSAKCLVAYIVPATAAAPPAEADIRGFLGDRLPSYMIPAHCIVLPALPLNTNGKVDRKQLPAPMVPQTEPTGRTQPRNEVERRIAAVWQQVLKRKEIGIHDNFFDLGGHSLLLIEVCSKLREQFGDAVTIVKLFQYPCIHELATHLSGDTPQSTASKSQVDERPATTSGDIAIIGMSGRFPGAQNIEQFWNNLENGVESIRFFSDTELAEAGVDPALIRHPDYVKAFGALEDIESFDAGFFGYSPAEAELMDPQHRLFLQCAWSSLEHAGYDVERLQDKVGVFAGASRNTYFYHHLSPNDEILNRVGTHQLLINNDNEFIPTRTSYKLNLRGPSINVQTACSTSLVAVHMACQSLHTGECAMALAGGVAVDTPQARGHLYQPDGIESPDGHCRAFDADGGGSVSGNGVGVVVLKPLAQALADGDTIHAVIKNTAVNNDGMAKVGYTAPGIGGQSEVIRTALGNLDVESIRFVETHGTGTPLGDPVEVEALQQAYADRTSQSGYCLLTALKTNIGHLDAAAGVAGLIKAALILQHRKVPPIVHFKRLNPEIDLTASPFTICAELQELEATQIPLRGAVSSFGIGGTNAHAILEAAPEQPPATVNRSAPAETPRLILLSAKSETALTTMAGNLADRLSTCAYPLADIASTLQLGRAQFAHRLFTVGTSADTVGQALATLDPSQVFSGHCGVTERKVAFLFPGVGDHYENMGADLYRSEPVFRAHFDHCCTYFKQLINRDLRDILFPQRGDTGRKPEAAPEIDFSQMLNRAQTVASQEEELLKRAEYNQPAVFAIEYALARLWMSWGVHPSAMLGYSLGEYVAACLSGVFTVEAAMELLAYRSRLIQDLPKGAMLAVLADADTLPPYLGDHVSLAIHSTSRQCVVAGLEDAVAALQRRLSEEGIASSLLPTSHPLHTPAMESCRSQLVEKFRSIELHPPQIPYISNVTGDWIRDEQACSAEYWADHTCKTVRFADGLCHLLQNPETLLVEVGPGRSLGVLANQHGEKHREQVVIASMRNHFQAENDLSFLLRNLGKLWLSGVAVDWQAFSGETPRRRVPLPTYPFAKTPYWIKPPVTATTSGNRGPGNRSQTRSSVREREFVLINGLDPLALSTAALLARQQAASITLLTREPFPEHHRWDAILADSSTETEGVEDAERRFQGLSSAIRSIEQATETELQVPLFDDFAGLTEQLNRFCARSVLDYLATALEIRDQDTHLLADLQEQLRILPDFEKFFRFMLKILRDDGWIKLQDTTLQFCIDPLTIPTAEEIRETILESVPELAASLEYLSNCVSQYPQALSGDIEAISVLYPEGRGADMIRPERDDSYTYTNQRLYVEVVAQIIAEHLADTGDRPLRILEVGGGNGFLTQAVISRLAGKDVEYFFTDLGPSLVRYMEADAKRKGCASMMQFGVLDISQDPLAQGFAPGSFDLILGLDVVHATPHIAKTLRNLKTLLAEDGLLCLIEPVKQQRWIDLAGGLAEGWWSFEDSPLREYSPLLDLNQWEQVLEQAGFPQIRSFPEAETARQRTDAALFVAQQGAATPAVDLMVDAASLESIAGRIRAIRALEAQGADIRIISAPEPEHGEANPWQPALESLYAPAPVAVLPSLHALHARPNLMSTYVAPRNAIETTVAGIWEAVLGVERIGVFDEFASLGGDSLIAIRITARIREMLGVHVPVKTLMKQPTVAALSQTITAHLITQTPEQQAEESEEDFVEGEL